MALSPKQVKAVKWYAEEKDLIHTFGFYPTICFKNKRGGEVRINILTLVKLYEGSERTEQKRLL